MLHWSVWEGRTWGQMGGKIATNLIQINRQRVILWTYVYHDLESGQAFFHPRVNIENGMERKEGKEVR